jgi:hypothetical protein
MGARCFAQSCLLSFAAYPLRMQPSLDFPFEYITAFERPECLLIRSVGYVGMVQGASGEKEAS